MATAKQIAANRRNAQKATGPRTAAGKAACRYNSIKHGLYATGEFIFDETPEHLAGLAAEYHEHYTPSNPEETLLVETLVASEWRLRRMRRVETHMWQAANLTVQFKNLVKGLIGGPDPCSSGDAFFTASLGFERHQRIVNSCERDFHRALKDLTERAHSLHTPQPEDSTTSSANLVPLSQNSQAPPTNPLATPGAPEIPETLPPESAPQTQHSAPSSAKLVPLSQNPQAPPTNPLATPGAPKTPEAPPPESAPQTQHSAPNSAKLVPLSQNPQAPPTNPLATPVAPKTPEALPPESASQTQHSAPSSAKLVPLSQNPHAAAPATAATAEAARNP
jgi:hypothetical protein